MSDNLLEKGEVLPELLKHAPFFVCVHAAIFGAEASDLANWSKVYHKAMSLSQTKGEQESPLHLLSCA